MNKFILLGNNSVSISRIGYGCSRLLDEDFIKSKIIIEECIKRGITHFDTAPSYGTESLLGEILSDSSSVSISSKIGRKRIDYNKSELNLLKKIYKKSIKPIISLPPSIKIKIKKRFIKEADYRHVNKKRLYKDEILIELEKTLRNLKRNSLDIFLIHEPDQFIIDEELGEVFNDLKNDGYFMEYGLGFGRENPDINFGKISQSKYMGNILNKSDNIKIFHGVIKKSIDSGNNADMHSKFIQDILEYDDRNMILFSSKNLKHIKSILF